MENTFWTGFGASLLAALVLAFTPLSTALSTPLRSRSAFSAGALVYVGATHLLPQSETERKRGSLFALSAGITVAFIIILSK